MVFETFLQILRKNRVAEVCYVPTKYPHLISTNPKYFILEEQKRL